MRWLRNSDPQILWFLPLAMTLLLLLWAIAGCSLNVAHTTAGPTPRWKQVLQNGRASPQCLALLNNSMSCRDFLEGNKRIYQNLQNWRTITNDKTEQRFVDLMMEQIVQDTMTLVNVPECWREP
jgi:hypothetical protein